MDVGSFLAIFAFIFYVVFSPVSYIFAKAFITATTQLIMRKYKMSAQLNEIEKRLKKFKMIAEALEEKKTEPDFKKIYNQVSEYLNLDVSKMTFA